MLAPFNIFLISKIFVITNASLSYVFFVNYIGVLIASILSFYRSIPRRTFLLFTASGLFFITGQLQAGISVFFLYFIVKSYFNYIEKSKFKKNSLIFTLAIISIVVAFSLEKWATLDFVSKYGRNQLLFGIFHPKEQAQLLLFIYFSFWGPMAKGKLKILPLIILIPLLVVTDSRSNLIGLFIFLFTYNFGFRILSSIVLMSMLLLITVTLIETSFFSTLSYYSSNRLELWRQLILIGYSQGTSSIDSSWLEFGRNGLSSIFFIILILIYLISSGFRSKPKRSLYDRFFPAFLAQFLFTFTFDLGAFSSTNFVAIMFWNYYTHAGYYRKKFI